MGDCRGFLSFISIQLFVSAFVPIYISIISYSYATMFMVYLKFREIVDFSGMPSILSFLLTMYDKFRFTGFC